MVTRRTKKTLASVAVIGVGPGDEALLTLRATHLIHAADLVVTDETIPESLLEHVHPDAEVRNAEELDVVAALVTASREGRRAARLIRGDAYQSTGTVALVEGLARAKVGVEVVPGVGVAMATASYAGAPGTTEFGTVSLVSADFDWSEGVPSIDGALMVELTDVADAGRIAAVLIASGELDSTPVAVTTGGLTAAQRTVTATLATIGAAVSHASGSAVLVAGEVVKHRDKLAWFERRPLFGWSVLVPRTRAQSGETVDLLRGLGASPLEVPTIAVEPPRTPAPMERAIKGLVTGRYAWVAFTSTNAVKAVREKLEEFGLDARAFAGLKIAAIGEQTAQALIDFGIRPDLLPSGEQTSEGLLHDFPPYDDVFDALDRVFLPRADIATETLVAGLKERGWAVDDITAYRTVRAAPPAAPIREAIKTGGVDAVLFTSSSTVRNLLGIAGKPHDSTIICAIGPATAATCRELGLRVDVLAETPTVDGLVAGLAEFALTRREEMEQAILSGAEVVNARGGSKRSSGRGSSKAASAVAVKQTAAATKAPVTTATKTVSAKPAAAKATPAKAEAKPVGKPAAKATATKPASKAPVKKR